MSHRDSNETGQLNKDPISPEAPRPEQVVDPLITEDYGTDWWLNLIAEAGKTAGWLATHTVKVDTNSRLVVEFQVVRRDAGHSSLLDSSVELPCGSLVPKGWPR